ncbi:hypothetical protein ACFL54_00905 [Planctomycetota bacterium]
MILVAPQNLWWLLLVGLVFLLVLLGRRRQKKVFSSVLLLRTLGGMTGGVRRRMVPVWWQFVFLAAAVICSVFFTAGLSLANRTVKKGVWNLYIDDSIEMLAREDGQECWDLIGRVVEEWMDRMGPGHKFNAYFASGRIVRDIPFGRWRRDMLRPSVFGRSVEKLAWPGGDAYAIYIGNDHELAACFPFAVCGASGIDNIAVTGFELKNLPDGSVSFFASIHNFSSKATKLIWRLEQSLEDDLNKPGLPLCSGEGSIDLSGRPLEISGIIEPASGNYVIIRLEVEDGFQFDNYAVATGRGPIRVACYGGESESALRKAILAGSVNSRLVEGVESDVDGFIFEGGALPAGSAPVLAFNPEQIAGIHALGKPAAVNLNYPVHVDKRWRRLNLDEIQIEYLEKYSLESSWKPILATSGGDPVIVTNGSHVVVLFDLQRSSWLAEASFPLFINTFLTGLETAGGWDVRRLSAIYPPLHWSAELELLVSEKGDVINICSSRMSNLSFPAVRRQPDNTSRYPGKGAVPSDGPLRMLLLLGLVFLALSYLVSRNA